MLSYPIQVVRNQMRSTKEEVKRKLVSLYSDSLDSGRNVLDFDKPYDFFSTDESLVLKFCSDWFWPEKHSWQAPAVHSVKHYQSLGQDDGGNQKICWLSQKQESVLKVEKPISNLTRDLEVLGRTPYQIGVDGEKFRVVAATLQKCNSPFIRRTFHFTSNGIVEAPEKKSETESLSMIPILKQTKAVAPPQKFVRIRRFRVIKKEDLPVDKYILPQKIKITNGEKTRFLTVRIRSKNSSTSNGECGPSGVKFEAPSVESPKIVAFPERKDAEILEANANSTVQAEEHEEADPLNVNTSEPDTSSASMDPIEEEMEEKIEEVRQIKNEEAEREEKNETGDTFKCENCGKQFLTYLSCLAHVRSHQRQTCQFCSKRFLTVKMLRDHVKLQHQHRILKSGTTEDRITTATSKFGRTRQVLNVAGLRSKYKML